jgi:hypothetical protein
LVAVKHLTELSLSQNCVLGIESVDIVDQKLDYSVEALAGSKQPKRSDMDAALGTLVAHADLIRYALVAIHMQARPYCVGIFKGVVADRTSKHFLK